MDDLGRVAFVLSVLKRERVPFADAWSAALPPSRAHRERVALREALTETAEAWRRAYVGEPAERGETAAFLLLGMLAERDAAEDRGEIVGVRCG